MFAPYIRPPGLFVEASIFNAFVTISVTTFAIAFPPSAIANPIKALRQLAEAVRVDDKGAPYRPQRPTRRTYKPMGFISMAPGDNCRFGTDHAAKRVSLG